MDLNKDERRGEEARRILQNELYVEAYQAIEAQISATSKLTREAEARFAAILKSMDQRPALDDGWVDELLKAAP